MIKQCKDELFNTFTTNDLFLADKGIASEEISSWKLFLIALKKPKK